MEKNIYGLNIYNIDGRKDVCVLRERNASIYDAYFKHITTFKEIRHPNYCCSDATRKRLYITTTTNCIYIINTDTYQILEKRVIEIQGEKSFDIGDFVISEDGKELVMKVQSLGRKGLIVYCLNNSTTRFINKPEYERYFSKNIFYYGKQVSLIDEMFSVSFKKSFHEENQMNITNRDIHENSICFKMFHLVLKIERYFGKIKNLEYITFDEEFVVFLGLPIIYVYSKFLDKTVKIKLKKAYKINEEYMHYHYYPEDNSLIVGTWCLDKRVLIVKIFNEKFYVAELRGYGDAVMCNNNIILLSDSEKPSNVIGCDEVKYIALTDYCKCAVNFDSYVG